MPLLAPPHKTLLWFFTRPKLEGTSCIVKCGEEVLLVHYKYGNGWNFPTGLIRYEHETPQEAAQRELREILSLRIQPPHYIGFVFCKFQYRRDRVYCFYSETDTKSFLISHRDVKNAQWFPINDLPQISQFSKEIIERWFRKRK